MKPGVLSNSFHLLQMEIKWIKNREEGAKKGGQIIRGTLLDNHSKPSSSFNHFQCLAYWNNGWYLPIICKATCRSWLFTCVYMCQNRTGVTKSAPFRNAAEVDDRSMRCDRNERDNMRRSAVLTRACETVACSAAVYDYDLFIAQHVSYLWHRWFYLFRTCTVCFNNNFIIHSIIHPEKHCLQGFEMKLVRLHCFIQRDDLEHSLEPGFNWGLVEMSR